MNKSFLKFLLIFGVMVRLFGTELELKPMLVRQIGIHGNDHFRDEALFPVMNIDRGKDLPSTWPESSLDLLLSLYHSQGYLLAQIDSMQMVISPDSQFVDIDLWIFEGEQVHVDRIDILGVKNVSIRQLETLLNTRSGHIFDERVLEQDLEQMLVYLENRGYPLSSVEIQSLSLHYDNDELKMDIVLQIEEGPLVIIGSIQVEGNTLTKEKVILRESRLKEGSVYNHQEVLSAQERLQKLEYFKSVDKPEVLFIQDKSSITLKVEEGNTNTMDGVVGYSPPKQKASEGYFTGRLQFAFRNLFGTGRFLEAYWEKKDEHSQTMQFGYKEPWLFGWPFHLGGAFQQEIRDTTYIERTWRFSVMYAPWASLSIHAEGSRREVLPDSLGYVLFDLVRTRSWLLSIGIEYNTLDDPVNPSSGVRYHTVFTTGKKRHVESPFVSDQEQGKQTVSTRKIEINAEMALPTLRYQVLYFGFHGVEVRTGDRFVPLSDQVRFGGTRTVRGYAEDAFRGNLVAWVNSEYRYLIGRHSRIFVFADGGIYQRREEELGFVKGTKIGYGFGIRLETRLGLIGIDYGLGEGDSLMRGKIHVGLVNQF